MVNELKPDLIVAATCAKALLPPITGLHEQLARTARKVFSIFDLMDNFEQFTDIANKKILVIDVVESFSDQNVKSVTIIEM